MISFRFTASGFDVGRELARDEEGLAYALLTIANDFSDIDAIAGYLAPEDRKQVLDLCNAIAISLGAAKDPDGTIS